MLDLASIFRNKKSTNPITLLSVVPNNDTAEVNLAKAKKKLGESIKYASASETNLDIIATIDYNVVGGIVRTSREKSSNLILSGWPHKSTFLDKFLGDHYTESIIEALNKDLFACQINQALVLHKKIVAVCPPLSEFEPGFKIWFSKIGILSKELSIPVVFYANERTQTAIENVILTSKLSITSTFIKNLDWEHLFPLKETIQDTDLLFVVSARKGAVSNLNSFDGIEKKLDKFYPNNNKLLVYPETTKSSTLYDEYGDMRAESLSKGLQTIQKVKTGIFNILKKNEDEKQK